MDFKKYQIEAFQFARYERDEYPAFGLAEETGEFLGILAKQVRGDDLIARFGSPEKLKEALMKEAGDILWMLAACMTELGFCLQEVAELNLKKLTDRQARGVISGSGDNR